jgi:hypothetical protein
MIIRCAHCKATYIKLTKDWQWQWPGDIEGFQFSNVPPQLMPRFDKDEVCCEVVRLKDA